MGWNRESVGRTPPLIEVSKQGGYLLLIVPVILVALILFGSRMLSRSKSAMLLAGSDLNYIQTQLCAQQCAALAVNRSTMDLELNRPIRAGTADCPCKVDLGRSDKTCASTIGGPQKRLETGCYGVRYEITGLPVSVTCKDTLGRTATLEEDADLHEVPVFQFAVFYEHFLEFENEPPMTVTGRVHSNDTIFLFPNSRLFFDDWVTTPKALVAATDGRGTRDRRSWNVYFGMKDGSGPDPVGLHAPPAGNLLLADLPPDWTEWKKTHRVAYQDQGNDCPPPQPLSVQLGRGADNHSLIEWRDNGKDDARARNRKFAWKASLIYKNGWLNADLSAATLVPNPVKPPPAPVFEAADLPGRVTFWLPRDNFMVKLIPIDMALLQQRPRDSIIYLYDSLPDPADAGNTVGGFLLYNGSRLMRPLTIVTNSRMVVMGDYNTFAGYMSGSGGASVFPSALISDCMLQLSREFLPSEHTLAFHPDNGFGSRIYDRRPGYALTLNSCVLTGMVAINGTQRFQGGFNNLIRMMEDWDGSKFRISGSMACLWYSAHSHARYSDFPAPERLFGYDHIYDDKGNMPPGTPWVVNPTLENWKRVR